MKKNVDPIEHYGTQINESFAALAAIIGTTMAGIIAGKKLFTAIKELRREFKDDAEIQAATEDLLKQSERVRDTVERKVTEKKKRHTKK
jgi:hypothetical protein